MTSRAWPAFVTIDLGDTEADAAEMERRWTVYAQDMAALIAAGGVRQDKDGWWVDDATGELIGPDPEIERPITMAELARAQPFAQVFPAISEAAQLQRGSQKP